MNLKALRDKFEALVTEQKTLFAIEEMSAEDVTRATAINDELKAITGKIELAKQAEEAQNSLKAHEDFLNKPVGTISHSGAGGTGTGAGTGAGTADAVKSFVIPATVFRSSMKTFTPENGFGGFTRAELEYKAYRMAQWFVGMRQSEKGYRDTSAQKWCVEHGVPHVWQSEENGTKAQVEGINSDGGFLVPEEIATDIIVLREKFGVMRQAMRPIPMTSDTKRVPRQTGNLTTYWVDENSTITESKFTTDSVMLVAKKLGALGSWSSEIGEDAFIDMGDKLAFEVAYAFGSTEDDTALNGDGSSTYGSIIGFRKRLLNLGTIANSGGIQTQTGTGAFSTTLADYQKVIGLLPEYADTPNVHWICHRTFWSSVMSVAELAAGGVTSTEVINGVRVRTFLGYPVLVSQKMPKVYAANDIPLLFGDFGLAGKFGDRRSMTLATSEHANFKQDQLVIRGTERFDIIVHDVGNNSATAALRTAGPVVALATGTS